jgi:phospho-N-acetylmuramoyl-pentapeptide-transferase
VLFHFLYEFLSPGGAYLSPLKIFNVIQYVSFRTAAATLTALMVSLLLGPWLIRRLQEFQIGQHIREEGPKSHQAKAGTPTMGGVLIVLSIVAPTLLWANLRNPFVWLIVLATSAYGGIGFADDYLKIRHKRNLGLTG